MSYPKYLVGRGSKSIFKFFNSNLGIAITDGCEMIEGQIIKSESGMRSFNDSTDVLPEWADDYTLDAVASAVNEGRSVYSRYNQTVTG